MTINAQTAEARHLESRLAEVDFLMQDLTNNPCTNARQLRQTPEGVDRLIAKFLGIREDLNHPTWPLFDKYQYTQLDGMMGRDEKDIPFSRIKALSQAFFGSHTYLERDEAEDLNDKDLQDYARPLLTDIIDKEVAELRKQVESKAITLTLPQAIKAAKFDSSKEGILAQKYEAAAQCSLSKLTREFNEVEAAYDGIEEEAVTVDDTEISEAVGSVILEPPTPRDPEPVDPTDRPVSTAKPVETTSRDGFDRSVGGVC